MFNFYLGFIRASVGGTVFITQVFPTSNAFWQTRYIAGVMLLLIGMIGVMYTGSLSHRYADMGRYAQGMDELRRYLFQLIDVSLPPIYQPFIQGYSIERNRMEKIQSFFFSVGTYHYYTILITSFCFAISIWLLGYNFITFWDISLQVGYIFACFFILFLCQSLYGKLSKESTIAKSGLALNVYRVHIPVNMDHSGE